MSILRVVNRWRLHGVPGLILLLALPASAAAQPGLSSEFPFGSRAEWAERLIILEQLALRTSDAGERSQAIIRIALPGSVPLTTSGIAYRGIVASLRRIYAVAGPSDRSLVVSMLSMQREREEAISFLSELARTDHEGVEYPVPQMAVGALSRMGQAGADVLRALHASGEGTELIRKQLEMLAATGYRQPPAGEAIPRRPPPLS